MTHDSLLSSDDRNPVDVLADEFADRIRRGESPSMREYIDRYPQHAEEIEALFPGVALLEQLSDKQQSESTSARRQRQDSLPPGYRFGDVEVIREVGRGGMGVVYEAYQHSLSRWVAIKAINNRTVHSANQVARFQREAQAAAQLHHTNIVPVFGVGEQDGISYYVMQLIHGQGLDSVLTELIRKTRRRSGGTTIDPADQPEAPASDVYSARELADVLISGQLSESSVRAAVGATAFRSNRDQPTTLMGRSTVRSGADPSILEFRAESRTEDWTGEMRGEKTPRTSVRSSLELRDESGEPAGIRSSLVLRDELPVEESFTVEEEDVADVSVDPSLASLGLRYWRNIARIGIQVASGLQYAHAQGTLHRDIKPANILLDTEGTAWIADFGLAKLLEQEDVTKTGDVVGTLRYMAPEQFRGIADARSDIYSLGLTLYELLTLRPADDDSQRQKLIARKLTPHDPTHPRKLHPGIPRDLETIVLKCLAWEPDGRYQSAGAVIADLQAFLEDRPIAARRISPVERFWRWCRRNPVVASLSTAVALLLMMHATLSTYGYWREKDRAEVMAKLNESLEDQRLAAEQSAREAEQLAGVQWDALNRIYETFVPDRFAAPVEASADTDEESGLETESSTPVLSPQTAAMLEEMLTSFDQIATIRGTDERYLEETARANRKVGDLHLRLGQYEEAAQSFERARERYQRLQVLRGLDPATAVQLAGVYNGLGMTYQHRGDPRAARGSLQRSLKMLTSLTAADSDPVVRREIAETHYLLGRRPPRGAPPPRRRGENESANRNERSPRGTESNTDSAAPSPRPAAVATRGERDGDRSRRGFDRSSGRNRGERRDPSRDSAEKESQQHLEQAIAILDKLIEEYPEADDYRFLDALSHIELSNVIRHSESETSNAMLENAVEMLECLVAEHPEEPDYLYQLSESYEQLYYRWKGDFRPLFLQDYPGVMQGRYEDGSKTDLTEIDSARAHLKRAVELSTTLMRQQPNVARYAESHRSLLGNLADAEAVAGNLDSARDLLNAAEQLQELLQTRFPDDNGNGSGLWGLYGELLGGKILMQTDQPSAAVEVLKGVLQKTLPLEDPGEVGRWPNPWRERWSSVWRDLDRSIYGMLAEAYQQLGDEAAAEESRHEADNRRAESSREPEDSSPEESSRPGATN